MKAPAFAAALSLVATGCLLILPLDRTSDSVTPTSTTTSAAAGAGGTSGTDGGAGTGGSGPMGECSPACGQADLPSVCRSGACVPLATPECIVVHGNWRDPNALVVGAYTVLPLTDPEGSTSVWDYELGIDELNDKGGLPDASGVQHPLVIVVCTNDASAPGTDTLAKSLNHLVDDLDVPAIVADLAPANLARAFKTTSDKGKSVFFLSPGAATKELRAIETEGLLWHMTGSPKDLGPAYASLVRRLEQLIRKDPNPLRVAVVKTGDTTDPVADTLGELHDAVVPLLVFNNQNRAANEAAGNYKEFVVDAAHPPETVSPDIVTFEPHIVISMIGSRFTDSGAGSNPLGVASAIEQTLGPTRFRPYYVLNPVNAGRIESVKEMLKGFFQLFPDIYERFLGINIAGAEDQRLYHEYLDRLRARFPKALPETENFYDPIYYLAYSMYIAGVGHHLDGSQIRSGMLNLLFGQQFDVGPDPIPSIFDALRAKGSSIQLQGTMGLPFFESGARKGKGALYCFADQSTEHMQEQVYDADQQSWSGMFGCYGGFPP